MSLRGEITTQAEEMSREELENYFIGHELKATDRRWAGEQLKLDLETGDADGAGVLEAKFFEMPTVLDAKVRVQMDDGTVDWLERDEATFKQHVQYVEWCEHRLVRAAGIRRRKGEKLHGWDEGQGLNFDRDAPIGPYLWRDVCCAICGKGYLTGDPFEQAHDVAVALGGGDGTVQWAHRSCNRAEGVN